MSAGDIPDGYGLWGEMLERVRAQAAQFVNCEPDDLAFLKQIRASYPRRKRIYRVQDNVSANWTPDIRAYAEANNIALVPPRPTPAI